MKHACIRCGAPVDPERAEVLEKHFPDKDLTCLDCSPVQAPLVLMDYSHKTAGRAIVVPGNPDGSRNLENDRMALRAHRRSR